VPANTGATRNSLLALGNIFKPLLATHFETAAQGTGIEIQYQAHILEGKRPTPIGGPHPSLYLPKLCSVGLGRFSDVSLVVVDRFGEHSEHETQLGTLEAVRADAISILLRENSTWFQNP
jgi:hypothetical protein